MKLADSKVHVVAKEIIFRSLLISTLDPVFEVDSYRNRLVELRIPSEDIIPDLNVPEYDNSKLYGFQLLKEIRNLGIFKDKESIIANISAFLRTISCLSPATSTGSKGKVIQSIQKRNQGISPHY